MDPQLSGQSVSFLKQRTEPALAQPQGCLSQCPQRAPSSWNWKPPETGAVAKKMLAEAAPPSSSYCGRGGVGRVNWLQLPASAEHTPPRSRPWRREARGREALGHEPRPQHNGARWWPRGSHRLTGRHQTGMRSSTRMRPACCATPIPAPRHSANLLKRRVSTPLKVVFALALNSENKKYISLLTKFTG